MLEKRFSKFDNFVFDLDGTVWYWTELIPNALKVFRVLEKMNKNVIFLTNNASLTRQGFAKKLQNFGINTNVENIFNPTLVAVKILKGKRVFCIGEGIIIELKRAKIKVSGKPDAVLISEDRNLTFDKLTYACNAIDKGAKFYKTAIGGAWVMGKKRLPGAGAIAAVVELCSGRQAELIGKPSNYMKDLINKISLDSEKTVLFGDECDSDIYLGNKLGFTTVLVLTGRDTQKDYLQARDSEQPKMVLKSISEMICL